MPPFQMNGDYLIGRSMRKARCATKAYVTEITTIKRRVMLVFKAGRVRYLPLGKGGVTGLNRPCVMRELEVIGFGISFITQTNEKQDYLGVAHEWRMVRQVTVQQLGPLDGEDAAQG